MANRQLVRQVELDSVCPIPGKDRIQKGYIKGWSVIIPKKYKAGEVGIFYEIDSVLRDEVVEAHNLRSKRIKTMKMAGVLSQGLFLSESDLTLPRGIYMDVKKWEPEVKEFKKVFTTDGNLYPFPSWIQKTDEERIQNCPQWAPYVNDKEWVCHEKIDGMSITYYVEYKEAPWWRFWNREPEVVFGVCSRNWELETTQHSGTLRKHVLKTVWKVLLELIRGAYMSKENLSDLEYNPTDTENKLMSGISSIADMLEVDIQNLMLTMYGSTLHVDESLVCLSRIIEDAKMLSVFLNSLKANRKLDETLTGKE